MADRQSSPQYFQPRRPTTTTPGSQDDQSPLSSFMWRIQNNRYQYQYQRPSSAQAVGLLTLAITGGILLLLTGITMTTTFMAIIFFSPFLFITSPIWVPFAALTLFIVAGFLSMFGFGLVAVAAVAWVYRYFRGFHPPGSDRVDYARNRIVDTATHVKDYAREYGGFSQNKVKDAAPGA